MPRVRHPAGGGVVFRNDSPGHGHLRSVCDLMREYCFTVECEQRTLAVRYNSRELTFIVLGNPLLPTADDFKRAVGLWDNFSVANGMDTKAWTTKSRSELLRAAERFRQALEADGELLQYDYQYGFSSIPKQRNSAAMGVGTINGKGAVISAKHPGQLYLEIWEQGPEGKGRIVETKDLRKGPPVAIDKLGSIKVYRRKNKVDWKPKLSRLIVFLQTSQLESVRIRHHYPE